MATRDFLISLFYCKKGTAMSGRIQKPQVVRQETRKLQNHLMEHKKLRNESGVVNPDTNIYFRILFL